MAACSRKTSVNFVRLLVVQDIIQHSAKGELHVAQLESAARQMSAYAQSNRLKQLASLIVARTSPAEVRYRGHIRNLQPVEAAQGSLPVVAVTAWPSVGYSTSLLTSLCLLDAPQEIQNLRELFGALDEAKSGRIPVAKLQVRRRHSSLSVSPA